MTSAFSLHFFLLSLLFLELLILDLLQVHVLATLATPGGLVGQNRATDSPAVDFLTGLREQGTSLLH